MKQPMVGYLAGDGIVEVGRELLAPTIELEVEQQGNFSVRSGVEEGDGTMVAGPRVIGVAPAEEHTVHLLGGEML